MLLLPNYRNVPHLARLEAALTAYNQALSEGKLWVTCAYDIGSRHEEIANLEESLQSGGIQRQHALESYRQFAILHEASLLATERKSQTRERLRLELAQAIVASGEELKKLPGLGDSLQLSATIRYNIAVAGDLLRSLPNAKNRRDEYKPRTSFHDDRSQLNLVFLRQTFADIKERVAQSPVTGSTLSPTDFPYDRPINMTRPEAVTLPEDYADKYPAGKIISETVPLLNQAGSELSQFCSRAGSLSLQCQPGEHAMNLLKVLTGQTQSIDGQRLIEVRRQHLHDLQQCVVGYQESYARCWALRDTLRAAVRQAIVEIDTLDRTGSVQFMDLFTLRVLLVNCASAYAAIGWSRLVINQSQETIGPVFHNHQDVVRESERALDSYFHDGLRSARGFAS